MGVLKQPLPESPKARREDVENVLKLIDELATAAKAELKQMFLLKHIVQDYTYPGSNDRIREAARNALYEFGHPKANIQPLAEQAGSADVEERKKALTLIHMTWGGPG